MLGPDAIDKVQYLPPDKVKKLQHADPDKRQKFSRTLEEEEEELEKRRKREPKDEVDLESADRAGNDPGREQEPEHSDGPTPTDEEDTAPEASETDPGGDPQGAKHIDLRA